MTRSVAAPHTRAGSKIVDQALGAGVDPRTVAGRLGHANPNVTMTVYGHFLPEKDRAAADFLDDLLDGTGGG